MIAGIRPRFFYPFAESAIRLICGRRFSLAVAQVFQFPAQRRPVLLVPLALSRSFGRQGLFQRASRFAIGVRQERTLPGQPPANRRVPASRFGEELWRAQFLKSEPDLRKVGF